VNRIAYSRMSSNLKNESQACAVQHRENIMQKIRRLRNKIRDMLAADSSSEPDSNPVFQQVFDFSMKSKVDIRHHLETLVRPLLAGKTAKKSSKSPQADQNIAHHSSIDSEQTLCNEPSFDAKVDTVVDEILKNRENTVKVFQHKEKTVRYNRKILQVAVSLFSRSRKAYEELRAANVILLPSVSTVQKYVSVKKNSTKSESRYLPSTTRSLWKKSTTGCSFNF
jgi:hypothetical protein